jgi:hypothetical protein
MTEQTKSARQDVLTAEKATQPERTEHVITAEHPTDCWCVVQWWEL